MNIKYSLLTTNAKTPEKAHSNDACFDLFATSVVPSRYYVEYGTGVAFDIPKGYCGLVFPRSSVSNLGLTMANSVGVIDADYTGEVKIRFYKTDKGEYYRIGDRVGQLMIMPVLAVKLENVAKIEKATKRGTSGYGSSGR